LPNFFVFHEVASVSRSKSGINSLDKTLVVIKVATQDLSRQFIRVQASFDRDLSKTSFRI